MSKNLMVGSMRTLRDRQTDERTDRACYIEPIVGKGVVTPQTKMQPHPALATPGYFLTSTPQTISFNRIQNYSIYELYRKAEELDQVDELADRSD